MRSAAAHVLHYLQSYQVRYFAVYHEDAYAHLLSLESSTSHSFFATIRFFYLISTYYSSLSFVSQNSGADATRPPYAAVIKKVAQ